VPPAFGIEANASSTRTTSASSGKPFVGATSDSSAAKTVKDKIAKIKPIRRVAQEVLGPVMKRTREFITKT
jgi:hypothetical protein